MKTLLVLLCLSVPASASCFSNVRFHRVRTVKAVKHFDKVQTLFLVAPPSYYGAPQYSAPQSVKKQDEDLKEILTKVVAGMARLEQRMDALEATTPPPVPVPPSGDVPLILEQQCGKCHGEDAAGGFTLSDLSNPRTRAVALGLVSMGKMPQDDRGEPVQLSPAVRSQLLQTLKGE